MGKELQHTGGAVVFLFMLPIYTVCLGKMKFKDFIIDEMTG